MVPDMHYEGSPLNDIRINELRTKEEWDHYMLVYREVQQTAPLVIASNDHPLYHIGKRSAAGHYCYDCNVTLCLDGVFAVHMGKVPQDYNPDNTTHAMVIQDWLADKSTWRETRWADVCPKCGKEKVDEHHAASIELGLRSPNTSRPKGVWSCSSFTWAQNPVRLWHNEFRYHPGEIWIVDEYGTDFTCAEFCMMVLTNCPINDSMSAGTEFS